MSQIMNTPAELRAVQSFVRRQGRLTPGQKRALEELWPRYGLPVEGESLDLDLTFGRRAPRVLEIGFGNGETLVARARAEPEVDFLGIEVHRPGVGHLLSRLAELELSNVRVFCADAVDVLHRRLADAALDRIDILFPDPWPKKRHHKRRLIQPSFVVLLALKLKPGGLLHLATDWADYAMQMRHVMDASPAFEHQDGVAVSRPMTKFERRGRRLGHEVSDLLYRRL